jgi:hypothetical protein
MSGSICEAGKSSKTTALLIKLLKNPVADLKGVDGAIKAA